MVTGSVANAYPALPLSPAASGAAGRATGATAPDAAKAETTRPVVKVSDYANLTRGELASLGREFLLRGAISKDELSDFERPSVSVTVAGEIAGPPKGASPGEPSGAAPAQDAPTIGYEANATGTGPAPRAAVPEARVSLRV